MRRCGLPLFWLSASLLLHGFLLLGGKTDPIASEAPEQHPVEIGLVRLPPQKAAPPPLPAREPSPPPAAEKPPPVNHSDGSADPELDPDIRPRFFAPPSPPVESVAAKRPDPPEPAAVMPQVSEAPPSPDPHPLTAQADEEAPASLKAPEETLRPSTKNAPLPDLGRSERHIPLVKASPRYRQNAPPDYPRVALLRGWEGEVLLKATVGTDGRPRSVDLHRSSGHAALDEAALRAVRRWRFEPGRRGETPVIDTVLIPLEFRLRR